MKTIRLKITVAIIPLLLLVVILIVTKSPSEENVNVHELILQEDVNFIKATSEVFILPTQL